MEEMTSPPVVGEVYVVPCVHLRVTGGAVIYLPTLGPVHEDPSFAPDLGPHVHYDPRFFPLSHLHVPAPDGLTQAQTLLVIAHRVLGREVFSRQPMLCVREMPEWPDGHPAAPWVSELSENYRGCRVAEDGRCPHAGTDGRSFPRRADGSWTCIHGLRWLGSGVLD